MSSKVKRKVTVENSKEGEDQPRRPSVFERLGPNAVNVAAQPTDRHNRPEQNEKCRNWLRSGTCMYGNTCRFKHDPFPPSSRRASKLEKMSTNFKKSRKSREKRKTSHESCDIKLMPMKLKKSRKSHDIKLDMDEKDLRHRVRTKRDEPKGSRTGSLSPKRIGKRSNSRSRKGEHESKIKSTVVVTRPRSPAAPSTETTESKKKSEGNWEDDSDDWPMDAAQLDFKEELTLERKRQQLQRELALELQKERLLNENVTITKTVSFSESSSSSSSSDSGSISSSSGSSSSSSDDDTDDSSSSSSSSSSSGSRPPAKRRNKKSSKEVEKSLDVKGKDDYDKIKSSRVKAQKMRSPSPTVESRVSKKNRDKRKESPQSPKRRPQDTRNMGESRSNLNVRIRGPRTPSPVTSSRKQRQWAQSSSTDSRSADVQRNRGKRHKKKRDGSRGDKYKSDRCPTPPPLSSPNRTALMPTMPSSKKFKQRDESGIKSRHRGRDPSPLLLSRNTVPNPTSLKLLGNSQRYIPEEKVSDKHRTDDRSKFYSRKDGDDLLPMHKRNDSRDRSGKRNRMSPRKDNRRGSLSPLKDRYDSEVLPNMKKLYPQVPHKDDKIDRRQASDSPIRGDRRKLPSEVDKKRDIREISPRGHDSRRDNQYRTGEPHYDKRNDQKGKRLLSPEPKKGRDDRSRDYNQKERNADYESASWSGDHRKSVSSTGRRTPEPRGRQELRSQPSNSQGDRSREREQDRKKRKERDLSARSEDSERNRLPSPRRSQSPVHGHHNVREIEPLTGNRGRIYDADVPPGEREYAYGYDPLHDPYINERLLPPDYDSDVMRGPSIYPTDVYPESRYRRDGKEPAAIIDRYGPRDVLSPREILPHRDIISLTGRTDDYIPDIPIEERGYDERWSRGRGRDDWDAYPTIPPAPLPPHVAAALDEDRYGMPRRRRASPEWQRGRMDDRDTSLGGHRQLGRGQVPPDGRSQSPPKGPGGNRRAWGDRGGRHDSRNDNRHEDSQKGPDERKGRNSRKDRGKRKDDPTIELKPSNLSKEKPIKRPHSVSPVPKDLKRRRDDAGTPENVLMLEKGPLYKRNKDEIRVEPKTVLGRTQKSNKLDTSSPRSDISHSSLLPIEKADIPKIPEGRSKDERKSRHDNARGEDDFSDWSDGDDDLLNRDDFVDSEGTNDNTKVRHRSVEKLQDEAGLSGLRRKERPIKEQQPIKKLKESSSRTSSRDRSTDEVCHIKDKLVSDSKDADVPETLSLKDDTATDVDEYITAESVDYDPISDDELDALIEEPEEPIPKTTIESEKSKIVDALDVNWSTLTSEAKTEFKPGFARRRYTAPHILARIGFSQVFAGPELSEKIVSACQKQLDEEHNENEGENSDKSDKKEKSKFVMEHQIAAFHVAISQTKKERINVFNKVGPYRRALCARRDLQLRNLLCKPINKFAPAAAVSYSPQYSVVDKDLYKQSLELLKRKSSPEAQPQTVNVC